METRTNENNDPAMHKSEVVRRISHSELIPEEALKELIFSYEQRWSFRKMPNNLAELLNVLE